MTGGSIKRDGDAVVIRVPLSEVHALRVALAECPCKAAKSVSTVAIRERLAKGLAQATSGRVS